MVFNFSEGYGPLFFANQTKFDPRVAYDPSILEAFNTWVIENRPKPVTTPPDCSPQKNHAPVHEVQHPIPVIGREIQPSRDYGNEPPPPGLEPDNDEGYGEQMEPDEDFLPPPPPLPSPPNAVLLPIGHGRPRQRLQAQAPQPLYMPLLPHGPQQQFNIPPPHPLFRFQQPQNQLPVGHAHWQHQNPQAQEPQQVLPPPLFPINRLHFPLHGPVQHQHPYMFPPPGHPHHPRAQLPIDIPLHGQVQHQHPNMPNHFFVFPPPGHQRRAHWNQPGQNLRFFPPAGNELFRRLQQWRGPPIDPRRPRNQ